MNLFDVIPENLFSILSSPNKRIYIDTLFIIRECFKQEVTMPKEEVAILIESKLEDALLEVQNDSEEEEKIENSLSAKAHYILRRLNFVGWIETEIQSNNFEEYIILPDYAIEIIDLLYLLTNKKNFEYNAYAYATYAALKISLEDDNKQLYVAVMSAYDNTMRLINSIKSLHHNLGRYYRKIIELDSVNKILEEHFDNYKEYIDRIYHPLKTDDPVDKYKVPICKMVEKIIGTDELFDDLLEQAMKSGVYEKKDDAKTVLLTNLNEIQDVYTNINKQISLVDRKNTEYVRATNRRIGYMLMSDKELKGKLINILKNAKNEKVTQLMEDNSNLFMQRYVDKDSIYLRASKSEKKQGKPLKLEEIEIDSNDDLKEFAIKIQNSYTAKRVSEYMSELLSDKSLITTNDIYINSDEEFILLILGAMSEEKGLYDIEYTNEYVKRGKYRIPNMVIKKVQR